MQFLHFFDVFSRRQTQSPRPVAPLTSTFRNRLLMLCIETFGAGTKYALARNFWGEIHRKLRYLVGTPQLSEGRSFATLYEDATDFLKNCSTEHICYFIEYIFQTEAHQEVSQDENAPSLVNAINDLFLADDLPYAVTPFVWETQKQLFYGQECDARVIASYPRVIRRDDQVTHAWAIEPALTLLRDKQFTSANKEFLEALEDYRKSDYGDCLTKCGSAFESTMKIICDRKGWPYSQDDSARTLLLTVLRGSQLEQNHFEQPLLNIATLRNKLSKAHGAGTQQRTIPQHVAKYAINATAAALLLLVEECT